MSVKQRKEMAATSPVRVRRHSLMYETILIRQICEQDTPPSSFSAPAAEVEDTGSDPLEIQQLEDTTHEDEPHVTGRRKSRVQSDAETLSPLSTDEEVPDEIRTVVAEKIFVEFNKFRKLESSRYFYFSEMTGFRQEEDMESLTPLFENKNRNYWFNITEPVVEDLEFLMDTYGVNQLTVSDILAGSKQEKMEVYQNYTFVSLRRMAEEVKENSRKVKNTDLDFNIILFKDFIITVLSKPWPNMCGILGFLNLLSSKAPQSVMIQDWVLFSCFIELRQDAKNRIELTKPDINQVRLACEDTQCALETSDIMRRNFDIELQVDAISDYIKPKMKILKDFGRHKYSRRLNANTKLLCSDIYDDFQDLNNDLEHFIHVLERSQDTLLAFVREDHAREANALSAVMKRTSELALIFIPKNIIGMFFGMNVMIPFSFGLYPTQLYFWIIILIATVIGLTLFGLRARILG